MKLLEQYLKLQKEIYDYFGYVEDWCVIPLDDATKYYWCLNTGIIRFCDANNHDEAKQILLEEAGDFYENETYINRHIGKAIFEALNYTMIIVDTHTDGNKFLQIFDNSKRIKEFE